MNPANEDSPRAILERKLARIGEAMQRAQHERKSRKPRGAGAGPPGPSAATRRIARRLRQFADVDRGPA